VRNESLSRDQNVSVPFAAGALDAGAGALLGATAGVLAVAGVLAAGADVVAGAGVELDAAPQLRLGEQEPVGVATGREHVPAARRLGGGIGALQGRIFRVGHMRNESHYRQNGTLRYHGLACVAWNAEIEEALSLDPPFFWPPRLGQPRFGFAAA